MSVWTDEKINHLMKFHEEAARETFYCGGTEELGFTLFTGYDDNDNAYVCPMSVENHADKQHFYATLRKVFAEKKVTAYSVVTEAWTISATAEKPHDMKKWAGKLDQHPDRKEILMLLFVSKDIIKQRTYSITRDTGRAIISDFPDTDLAEKADSLSGDMMDLLKPKPAISWQKSQQIH